LQEYRGFRALLQEYRTGIVCRDTTGTVLSCRDTDTGILYGTNLERSAECVELLTHDADVSRALLSV